MVRRIRRNFRPKYTLLISVEGNQKNKTEKTYFNHFKGGDWTIYYAPGNETNPEDMVKRLLREYDARGLDKDDLAVCLVDADIDSNKDKQLQAAERLIRKSGKKNVYLIVSAPCFEIWFLCHFGYSARQYQSSREVVKELEKYIPGYEKSMDVFSCLLGKEAVAIANARKLEAVQMAAGKTLHTVGFSPSTEVYKIFEESICKK